ncbi:relaxase/mobilization nuclease domain-containing protein [Mucilaginibacter ximonensis]|uniref:Relaxase/mobilization nuclease domain-containing protein n=1 Tax=Mucilaginibacter ximonensis TaxID=538021 RepID=A0ABW5YEI2_9SPHI
MVARIVCGKSIRGVLNYNENKLKNAEASLLLAAGFPRDPDHLSFKNKLHRFEMLTRQNTDTRTNTLHIMLNFSRRDELDEGKLKAITFDYMNSIGFGEQPFLVYQHFDAAHPHLHIATVNIADGGRRIETHNIGRHQSEKARKEIETSYNLIRAEDQAKETAYTLQPVNLDKIMYGKTPTKAAISAIVREVVDSYKFTSLPELNAALRQFNVRAYRGTEGSQMFQKSGLVYQVLNEQGQAIGIPIKASSIYGRPTLKNLERKYTPNESSRMPYGQRLKHLLDKAIATTRGSIALQEQLQQQGIRMLFRENIQGNVYGVTFIDNATRVVYNGSDLGKNYSAKAFMARLPKVATANTTPQTSAATQKNYPAHNQPVIEIIADILLSAKHSEHNEVPYRKKKKKRLQID